MFKHLISKENRALLSELVRTDFKLRYQGSVLGYTWSLLKPLLMFGVLYVVFTKFLRVGGDIPHYPIYLLLGIVLWAFFGEMTGQSLQAIVARGDLIRKIKIPRWIIVMSASFSALINLILSLIIVGIFIFFNGADISWRILLVPLSILEIYVLALGLSFFLSAIYVKYRDFSNIWEVFIQAGFYVTPILYPLSIIPNEFFQKLLLINPIAQAIQDARYNLVTRDTITAWSLLHDWKVVVPFIIIAIVCIIGVLYFKSQSKYFAENL